MPTVLRRLIFLLLCLFALPASAREFADSKPIVPEYVADLTEIEAPEFQAKCACVARPVQGALSGDFFGIAQTLTGGANNPTITVGVNRTWDESNGCTWDNIETSPGVYSFTACDVFTDLFNSNGQTWSFAFGRTPKQQITTPANCAGTFAASNACCNRPKDLTGANVIVPNVVTAIVNHWNSRYPGKHFYLEGPNEADLTSFWCNDAGTGHGSMSDLVIYMTDIKTTALAIDPTITILGPSASTYTSSGPHLYGPKTGSTPSAGNGFLQQAGAAASFDVVNLHPYQTCSGNPCTVPESLISAISATTTVLNSFAGVSTKPVADSETDWGASPANASMSDDDRINWDARATMYFYNGGHVYNWKYQWTCVSGNLANCTGTHSGTGVGASVATALDQQRLWLVGTTHTNNSCNQNFDGHGTWVCTMITSGGVQQEVIFNSSGNQTITVPNSFTTIHNLDGTTSGIVGHQVTAGTKPIMIN